MALKRKEFFDNKLEIMTGGGLLSERDAKRAIYGEVRVTQRKLQNSERSLDNIRDDAGDDERYEIKKLQREIYSENIRMKGWIEDLEEIDREREAHQGGHTRWKSR